MYVAIVEVPAVDDTYCPQMMYTRSNNCKEPMMDIKAHIRIVGPSRGSVMLHCCRQNPAPSTFAASYRSSGIDCMPAIMRMTAKPIYFHEMMNIRVHIAIFGSAIQSAPLMPNFANTAFTAPVGCSIRLQPVPTMTSDTTYGTKIRVRIRARPLNFWFSRRAKRIARGPWITKEATTTKSVWPSAS